MDRAEKWRAIYLNAVKEIDRLKERIECDCKRKAGSDNVLPGGKSKSLSTGRRKRSKSQSVGRRKK